MTNTILTAIPTTVNVDIALAEADRLFVAWEAASAARDAAFEASAKARFNTETTRALTEAMAVERKAHEQWKAAEAVVRAAMAADEVAYEQFLCEQFDAMDNAVEYPINYAYDHPIPYAITPAGQTYLDRHYQTTLTTDNESPYGDGTTGWVQASPVPSYYQGTPDLDERDRLENLAY